MIEIRANYTRQWLFASANKWDGAAFRADAESKYTNLLSRSLFYVFLIIQTHTFSPNCSVVYTFRVSRLRSRAQLGSTMTACICCVCRTELAEKQFKICIIKFTSPWNIHVKSEIVFSPHLFIIIVLLSPVANIETMKYAFVVCRFPIKLSSSDNIKTMSYILLEHVLHPVVGNYSSDTTSNKKKKKETSYRPMV